MTAQIAVREPVAVEQCKQYFSVCLLHCISLSSLLKIKVQILPVHRDNTGRVLRLLHPSFNLERRDAALNEIRQPVEKTQVLRTQKVSLHSLSFSVFRLVSQPAGLCASSAVPASPAELAREQALSGITDTQGTVNECLHFQAALLVNLTELVKRHFPGGNDTAYPLFRQKGS